MKIQTGISTQPPTLGTITTKEQQMNNPQCTVECIHPETICVPQHLTRTPPINNRDYISSWTNSCCFQKNVCHHSFTKLVHCWYMHLDAKQWRMSQAWVSCLDLLSHVITIPHNTPKSPFYSSPLISLGFDSLFKTSILWCLNGLLPLNLHDNIGMLLQGLH